MERFKIEYGLSEHDSRALTESALMAGLFEKTAALCGLPKKAANWLTGETSRLLKEEGKEAKDIIFSPAHLASLIQMTESGRINLTTARNVFEHIFREDIEPERYVKERGLLMVSDDDTLEFAVEAVLSANPQTVEEYKNGKEKVLAFLVGQVMRRIKGRANPGKVNEILAEKLK